VEFVVQQVVVVSLVVPTPCREYRVLIFIYMPLLSGGQKGEMWRTSSKTMLLLETWTFRKKIYIQLLTEL
jgi:hypothetical protein